mmetsp:Transcript_2609/g.7844  ORF Transcript_2609/g.7844 Transcript_2609/m.7844 type:complete len:271 (+) Transcript_2609:342-1154(+)
MVLTGEEVNATDRAHVYDVEAAEADVAAAYERQRSAISDASRRLGELRPDAEKSEAALVTVEDVVKLAVGILGEYKQSCEAIVAQLRAVQTGQLSTNEKRPHDHGLTPQNEVYDLAAGAEEMSRILEHLVREGQASNKQALETMKESLAMLNFQPTPWSEQGAAQKEKHASVREELQYIKFQSLQVEECLENLLSSSSAMPVLQFAPIAPKPTAAAATGLRADAKRCNDIAEANHRSWKRLLTTFLVVVVIFTIVVSVLARVLIGRRNRS